MVYRPGQWNDLADALSRLYTEDRTILTLHKTLPKKIQNTTILLLPTSLNPIQQTCRDSNSLKLNIPTTALTAIAIAVFIKQCLILAITETRALLTYGVTIGASAVAGAIKKYDIQRNIGQIALC